MKVILLQNVKGFGQIGDVKNVSDGYARNFLLPRKMAKSASEGNLKEVDGLKKKLSQMIELEKSKAAENAAKLKDAVLELTRKASKTGKLYSSVTKAVIAEELSKLVGGKVEPDMIDLKEHGEHIKQVGEHLIEINLAPEVKAELKVVVKAE